MHYRDCRLFAFLLIGWYLMLPPAGQRNGMLWPDMDAPISKWTIAKSFDSAKACKEKLNLRRKQFQGIYRKTNHNDPGAEYWSQF